MALKTMEGKKKVLHTGKRAFRSKRQRQMNHSSAGNRATEGTGTPVRSSGRGETTTYSNKPGEKAKKKHLKDSKDKKHIRENRRATAKRRRLAKLRRRRRKRYEDEENEDNEATPIGIKERLIHFLTIYHFFASTAIHGFEL